MAKRRISTLQSRSTLVPGVVFLPARSAARIASRLLMGHGRACGRIAAAACARLNLTVQLRCV